MTKARTLFKGIATAVAAIVIFSLPSLAGQGDETNQGTLLKELAQADRIEALRIDRQLQALWSASGSASMDLLLKRGRDALAAGDTLAAIEHLTALTDHAPGFAEGWQVRAAAYFEAGLYGPALSDLEHALALNPMNYNALFGLGTILETFGDKKRAYQVYQRVRAINPFHEEVSKALERLKPDIEGTAL